jgi:DedD protein
MDRRVKERLVGASILLVLIVLVVPELLSGPAPPPPQPPQLPAVNAPKAVRHVTVDLATSKPTEAEVAGSVPDEAPASAAPPPPQPPSQAPSVASEPGAAQSAGSAPLEAPAAPPISTASTQGVPPGHGWSVQLGSFASRANADKLVHQLKTQGFPAFISATGTGSAARYRVRVGPEADHGAAMQAAAKLKGVGHVGSLVAP